MSYRVSITVAGDICSSYLIDLIKVGNLDESLKYLAIDTNKIERATKSLFSYASKEAEQALKEYSMI